MTSRRRVSSTSGTSANGIPKDSTTWLITSDARRVEPDGEHDQRRRHRDQRGAAASGIVRAMKPCMTTWPGVGADARGREARGQQRERERERGAAADQRREPRVGALDRVDAGAARSRGTATRR